MSEGDAGLLELDDVSVRFQDSKLMGIGGSRTIDAVTNVSLSIAENEVVALVGESGCGKTTLGKTAIGLQRPTEGSVRYRGRDIWDAKDAHNSWIKWGDSGADYPEIRRSLQYIHQDPGESLNANYTIESILSQPLKRWEPDLSSDDRLARIYGLLEYVGMTPPEDFGKRYPHQLSGGEQQRVALIRAILMNPDLILADEAISALDVSLRVEMMDLMLGLQSHIETSYLFISHDISNARYLAEKSGGRIGVMYLGEIVEIGTAEEIIKNPQHPYTKALLWATPDIATIQHDHTPPLREIEVADAANLPTGCRFHPRCPEAREHCTAVNPEPEPVDGRHTVACHMAVDDPTYRNSSALSDEDEVEPRAAGVEAED